MNLFLALLAFLAALFLILAGVTRVGVWVVEQRNPPVGAFATVDGTRIHYLHVPAPPAVDLPTVVFIHGASGSLRDQMLPIRNRLEGRAELLFLDRPGHGWSQRGSGNETPSGQAGTIARLMDQLGIASAIIVGHSFGGGIAAAFALDHPQKVRGLVFLSAASHPWPDGVTSWYYKLTTKPVIGWLFSETLAFPGGLMRIDAATTCVFAPNPIPAGYARETGVAMVLRPANFRANAVDVESLHAHVTRVARRYPEIQAPTVVVSGDRDTVVYEEIHSLGLARDIPGAELVWIKNLGHKPDWTLPDLTVAAIEKVAGKPVDLQAVARRGEARIAGQDFGRDAGCTDPVGPSAAQVAQ